MHHVAGIFISGREKIIHESRHHMKNKAIIFVLALAVLAFAGEPPDTTAADTLNTYKAFVSAMPVSLATVLQGSQEASTVFAGAGAKKGKAARSDAVNVVVKKKVYMSGFDRFLDMWR
jgi:hypothetical protein